MSDKLRERVRDVAETIVKRSSSVGPLDILMGLQWLYWRHVEEWKKGHESYRVLEEHFQSTPEKRAQVFGYFLEWAHEQGMQPVAATYSMRTVRQSEVLRVTLSGDEQQEAFFRTHFARADLSPKKTEKLKETLNKAPELVAFIVVGKSRPCSECGVELDAGMFSVVEKSQPLCMTCADLDHLLFLPAGDATLTRRAKKLSPLSAVVVKFSRSRNRYERQGLLVTENAIAQAEAQCDADAPERAARRELAAELREGLDEQLVAEMTAAIIALFPRCPPIEAQRIAAHTAVRGSGRVGRSAAGRALDPRPLELAVIAHIRHEHTNYDELLMRGTDRGDAREMIRSAVQKQLEAWRG